MTGGRWFQIRRAAIESAAVAHLANHDDPDARRELLLPVHGLNVARTSPWFAVRASAIDAAALATLADRSADVEDRYCSRHARRALEHPLDDIAEASWVEGIGDLPSTDHVDALTLIESQLAAHGIVWNGTAYVSESESESTQTAASRPGPAEVQGTP